MRRHGDHGDQRYGNLTAGVRSPRMPASRCPSRSPARRSRITTTTCVGYGDTDCRCDGDAEKRHDDGGHHDHQLERRLQLHREKPGTYTVVFSARRRHRDHAAQRYGNLTSGGAVSRTPDSTRWRRSRHRIQRQERLRYGWQRRYRLSGVTVTLKNASGTWSDHDDQLERRYSFTGEAGRLYGGVQHPSGDLATTPVSDTVTLTRAHDHRERRVLCIMRNNGTASISGEVWNDVNASAPSTAARAACPA